MPCCAVLSCRMVRLITAGLVEVGHGRMTPAQFKKVLAAGDRSSLPVEAAPPHGLYLDRVSAGQQLVELAACLTISSAYACHTGSAPVQLFQVGVYWHGQVEHGLSLIVLMHIKLLMMVARTYVALLPHFISGVV